MQYVTEDGGVRKLITRNAQGKEKVSDQEDGLALTESQNNDPNKAYGTGYVPKNGDNVQVSYVGRLAETGKEFDASISGYPFSFTLGEGKVIKGWEHGIRSMEIGESCELHIRSDYGYGEDGDPGKGGDDAIPPGADLVFEVTLVSARPGTVTVSANTISGDMARLEIIRKEREEAKLKRQMLEEEKKKKKLEAQQALKEKLANKNKKGKGKGKGKKKKQVKSSAPKKAEKN
mmetsp:Transcript_16287/g.18443  ORF Transcript_16287/g.18443 Transcript_16287/m.18443 type:complete len:232 (-) Transcript_16287:711-1406(-)